MGTGEVLSWPKWARILAITLASVMAAIHHREEGDRYVGGHTEPCRAWLVPIHVANNADDDYE